MRKALITLTFSCLIGITATFAQKVNGIAVKDLDADYIEIAETPSYGIYKRIAVDFGQKVGIWSFKESTLTDNEGKPIDFNSIVAALNFMSRNGYELVDSYPVKNNDSNIQHYILKKKKI
jgi:hypothetical protein